MTAPGHIHLDWNRSSGLLVLRLDNSKRANAMDMTMLRTLADRIESIDSSVSAVVITGSHGRFSSGIDLNQRSTADYGRSVQDELERLTTAIRGTPVPIVSLIEAYCVGAAVELAVTCDLRIGVRPTRVKVPATRIGVVYRPDGYHALLRRLDSATVRQLLLLGLEYDADQAQAHGVFDAVVDDLSTAMQLIEHTISHLAGPTFAAQKAALDAALEARGLEGDARELIERLRLDSVRLKEKR